MRCLFKYIVYFSVNFLILSGMSDLNPIILCPIQL